MGMNFKFISRNTIIIISLILFFSTFSIAGKLEHKIINPYGEPVIEMESTYSSERNSDKKLKITSIATKFEEIDDFADKDDITEPFCQVGGMYKINVSNIIDDVYEGDSTVGNIPLEYNESFNLYYCKTIGDLIDLINIPSTWTRNNMIIYCNDGANINVPGLNFDLFTNRMNTYKACIIKNLEKDSENTIVYGLETGNKMIDNNEAYFFDKDTDKGPILKDLNYVEGSIYDEGNGTLTLGNITIPYYTFKAKNIYEDDNGRKFYFKYDASTNLFSLADFDADMSTSLSSIFNTDDLELSRIAVLKKINGKTIIGTETIGKEASNLEEYNQSYETIYTIELEGFDFNSDECEIILNQYETIIDSSLDYNTQINCIGNEIEIVSKNLDSISGETNSTLQGNGIGFHIFKNIITSLE